MATLTFPLSRIEGHAQVVIELDGERVQSAHFQATELRGFHHFVLGVPAADVPVIVPRICGVCSTAHHLAAVEALEDAYGVTPPPAAQRIRQLCMLGQLVQNQATSLFYFTLPDRLGRSSLLRAGASDAGAEPARSHLAMRAARVRKAGTELIRAAGGQFIHPVRAVVGGVSGPMDPDLAAAAAGRLRDALPEACDLFDAYWELSCSLRDRVGSWGDDAPSYYLAAIGPVEPDFTGDRLRVLDEDGVPCASFPARELARELTYEETDYSYAGRSTYRGAVIRANSLARVNLVDRFGTPRADEYLGRFREAFGRPAHAILLYDLARGIELVYGIERALVLLAEPSERPLGVPHEPRDAEGHGLVEAPRGPLVHRYRIEGGRVVDAEFIIPTVHNVAGIERALMVAATRHIEGGRVLLSIEEAVGRVVRAFDPCIACATH
jgi:F420-non-reducing hydrogenase large subunit